MSEIYYCPNCENDSFYCYPSGIKYKCTKCLQEFFKLPIGTLEDGEIFKKGATGDE